MKLVILRHTWLFALVAAASLITAEGARAVPGKLTISTGLWVGYGPLYLARDLGYFKEGGLDVTLIQNDDVVALGSSIASGAISGAAAEIDIMLPVRKNTCVKGVVALDDSSGADGIVATSAVADLADIKGKEIAVMEPGYPNVFFNYVLRKAGLKHDDVTVLNMNPQDAAAAFIAGRVPVAVTYEPSLTFVASAHKGRVLFDSSMAPGLIADLVYVRCDVIEQQPGDMTTLARGLFRADDYIKAHPDEAYDIMRKYVGGFLASRADFAAAAKGVTYYDHERNLSFLGSGGKPGSIMESVDFIYDVWGPLVPKLAYSDLFDQSFIN